MPVSWYDSTVTKIEDVTPAVRRFWLRTNDVARPDFLAGQFITIDLPIGEKRLQRWRSYSLADAPGSGEELELCIARSADGQGTRYLFEEIKPGSVLRWKGPDGSFVLPDKIENDLVFICTGTGIAPFRSMLRDILQQKKAHKNIHLIFGTRTEADILYRSEMESLARLMPGFQYDAVLSRQEDWAGYKGYVHQIYLSQYKEKRADISFYLCGWSNMIDEAAAHLVLQLGYDRSQVRYELYG